MITAREYFRLKASEGSEWKLWNKILILEEIFLILSTMNPRSQNSI